MAEHSTQICHASEMAEETIKPAIGVVKMIGGDAILVLGVREDLTASDANVSWIVLTRSLVLLHRNQTQKSSRTSIILVNPSTRIILLESFDIHILSVGLLAAATNALKHADGTSTVLKYNEPPEARKPAEGWRIYVFKGKEQVGAFQSGLQQIRGI
jgi:hypothetical protein